MNFQVPQFIEIEDKIFGPLTFKQFIYVAGSAGIAFIVYSILPIYLAIIPIILIISFGLALAFYQINNQPFINIVEAVFKYLLSSKLYIWKKTEPDLKKTTEMLANKTEASIPRLSKSKLKDLSWSLDVKENIK